jgi:hypothetical protein
MLEQHSQSWVHAVASRKHVPGPSEQIALRHADNPVSGAQHWAV